MGGRTEKLKGRTVTSQPLTWNTVYDPGQPVLLQTEDQPDMWEQAVCYATEFIDGIVQYTVIVGVENEARARPPPCHPRCRGERAAVASERAASGAAELDVASQGHPGPHACWVKAPSSLLDVERVAKVAVGGRIPVALGDEGAPRRPPWTI